jgi:hypothetical protein
VTCYYEFGPANTGLLEACGDSENCTDPDSRCAGSYDIGHHSHSCHDRLPCKNFFMGVASTQDKQQQE